MAEMSHPDTEARAEVEGSSQAAPKDTRPLFEVGYHVVPTVEEAKVSDVSNALRDELEKIQAEITKEQSPTKMTLTYTIERAASGKREKYGEAYFGWIRFAVKERDGIPAVLNFLQNKKEILRFLLIEIAHEEQVAPRRAVFSSNRLLGETIKKPTALPEAGGEVSEEELNKSIEALMNDK